MTGGPFRTSLSLRSRFACLVCVTALLLTGCGLELPEVKPVEYDRFDLSQVQSVSNPPRPQGYEITDYAVEYTVDLGIPEGQPGQNSEVRVILPSRSRSAKVPALILNGSGAYLFSGMVLGDEDIEPMLPYVKQGFAIVAYETDGCQPSFERDPTAADISQMTRQYVASKAGLINAKRALSFALERFPELDSNQLYAIGHSSGGKQALLLAAHDDRIQGCVAFAPACRMDAGSAMTVARIGGPDASMLASEVNRSMPIVHAGVTKTPTLLIYSPSDRITRPDEVLSYAKAVGKTATAIPVQCDGHGYVPDAGFRIAMVWLHAQAKKNGGLSNATQLVSQQSAATPEDADISDQSESNDEPAEVELPRNLTMPVQTSPFGKAPGTPSIQSNPYAK